MQNWAALNIYNKGSVTLFRLRRRNGVGFPFVATRGLLRWARARHDANKKARVSKVRATRTMNASVMTAYWLLQGWVRPRGGHTRERESQRNLAVLSFDFRFEG